MLQSQNCGNKQDIRGASAIVQWVNKQAIETLEKAAIKVKRTQLGNPKKLDTAQHLVAIPNLVVAG